MKNTSVTAHQNNPLGPIAADAVSVSSTMTAHIQNNAICETPILPLLPGIPMLTPDRRVNDMAHLPMPRYVLLSARFMPERIFLN